MQVRRGTKLLVPVVAALLLAALAPLAVSYFHESAWRISPEDRPFVDRALAGAAEVFGTSQDEYRLITRPRVRRMAGRTCVDLRTAHSGGDGSYFTCYDRDGRTLFERAIGHSFGSNRISDRLRALIW